MAENQAPPEPFSDSEMREAREYWAHLFEPDKRCTELLERLLLSIAKYIVSLNTTLPWPMTNENKVY
jgi:hypothetical protein